MAKKLISVTIMLMLLVTSIVSASGKVVIEKNPYKDPKKAFHYVYDLCVIKNSIGGWETYMLGSYYEKGYGTKKNITKAYAWLKMSTDQKYKPSIVALSKLKNSMTRSQINIAEKEYKKIGKESVDKELQSMANMNK